MQTLRADWDQLALEPRGDGTYDLAFTYEAVQGDGAIVRHTETVHAVPRLNRRQLARVERAFAADRDRWEAQLALLAAEKRYLAQQGAFLHQFALRGLGVINIDKLQNAEAYPIVSLRFDFEGNTRFQAKHKITLVDVSAATVLTFQSCDWDRIPVPPGEVHLYVVLEDGTAAVLDAAEFDAQVRRRASPRPFTTELSLKPRRLSLEEALAAVPPGPSGPLAPT